MAIGQDSGKGMMNDNWTTLRKVGGVAALLSVALIPIQITIFIVWPPPKEIINWFSLFQENWLLGLLSLDLLYMLNNTLLIFIYLAFYFTLKSYNNTLMTIALVLGLVGISAYFSSNTAFEMLSLSHQFGKAVTGAERAGILSAGRSMLAIYKGTAFDTYYVFNAITLLIISVVMIKSNIFSKLTGYIGLLSGILMIVPSTAGKVGLIFSLLSLPLWILFSILVAFQLFRFGSTITHSEADNHLKLD